MKGLGNRLKKARSKNGLTQTQAGDLLGISFGTLSGYEREYRRPDNETLVQMAKLYHVEVTWLLGIDDEIMLDAALTEKEKEQGKEFLALFSDLTDQDKIWLLNTMKMLKKR